jgi:hypothetical protein
MIFPAIVNDSHSRCLVTCSNDQKLYYRRMDKKGRPAPSLKRLKTRQTDKQFIREHPATNAAVYYVE